MKNIKTICIIGAGNVASHLAKALFGQGLEISQVVSRHIENCKPLANEVGATYTNNISDLHQDSDLYIISVSDDQLSAVIQSGAFDDKFTVHTAGSASIEIFKEKCNNYGVFYPLQTFSKDKKVDFTQIPLCIEANNTDNCSELINLATKISSKVYQINSEQRRYIHIAAVFGCNFVNHFYGIASKMLEDNNIPYEIMFPLFRETLDKALKNNPFDVQTGPAVRNDMQTINKHIELLNDFPDLQKLYSFVTDNIQKEVSEF